MIQQNSIVFLELDYSVCKLKVVKAKAVILFDYEVIHAANILFFLHSWWCELSFKYMVT